MGEVKLPGTLLGRSAFDPALLQDSFNKAVAENCRYFFRWNVEELALFDRSIWDAPSMHDRLVGYWKLGLNLNSPTNVGLPEIRHRIFSDLLPRALGDISRIVEGERKGDFALAPSDFYFTVLERHLAGSMGPARLLLSGSPCLTSSEYIAKLSCDPESAQTG